MILTHLNIKELLAQACLALRNSPSPEADAEYLLSYILKQSRSFLRIYADKTVSMEDESQLNNLLSARKCGKPIAYLTHRQGFWKYDFAVNEATLIPRPETEVLIEIALSLLDPHRQARILDLGTGSGVIGITLALVSSQWEVTATDISSKTLEVASENAKQLGAKNITFIESDWFAAVPPGSYDLIVSNPPYLAESDPIEGDLSFEPVSALKSGPTGLYALQTLIENAQAFMRPSSALLLEHGYNQEDAVHRLMKQNNFHTIQTFKDLGGWPRASLGFAPP